MSHWWVLGHPEGRATNPAGPPEAVAAQFFDPEIGPLRVVKGGSWLCSPGFCLRYRPAARQPQEMELGANHIGFRVVMDLV
jgi:formylglycine-generating enzyme required for sulfatase activity